jgi:hypothetical protein
MLECIHIHYDITEALPLCKSITKEIIAGLNKYDYVLPISILQSNIEPGNFQLYDCFMFTSDMITELFKNRVNSKFMLEELKYFQVKNVHGDKNTLYETMKHTDLELFKFMLNAGYNIAAGDEFEIYIGPNNDTNMFIVKFLVESGCELTFLIDVDTCMYMPKEYIRDTFIDFTNLLIKNKIPMNPSMVENLFRHGN